MPEYSQSGINDKRLKMPVCEDFRFLALLNIYSVDKHAVLRKNFCRALEDVSRSAQKAHGIQTETGMLLKELKVSHIPPI